MTKYTLVTDDKIIIKDGEGEIFNDDTFWSNYSSIHAIQIDTDGVSEIENKDNTSSTPSQSDIDTIANKYETVKTARLQAEQTEIDSFYNTWDRVRIDRDRFILDTDKYLLNDYPISDANKTLIQTYRTSLRDIPQTYSSEEPSNIVFDESGNVSVNGTQVITKPTF